MKTNILPIKALLAVLAAIIFLPIGVGAACMAFAVTGLIAVFLGDYGRSIEPLRASAQVLPFRAPARAAALVPEAA
jgi:hypothetical protein